MQKLICVIAVVIFYASIGLALDDATKSPPKGGSAKEKNSSKSSCSNDSFFCGHGRIVEKQQPGQFQVTINTQSEKHLNLVYEYDFRQMKDSAINLDSVDSIFKKCAPLIANNSKQINHNEITIYVRKLNGQRLYFGYISSTSLAGEYKSCVVDGLSNKFRNGSEESDIRKN